MVKTAAIIFGIVFLAVGILGSMVFGKLVQNLMFGADPVGFPVSAGAAAMLVLTTGLAVWIATRRVTQLDTMTVLRSE